jgi:hypothetical protein
MQKPQMVVSEPYWDYSDVIKYIEEKYGFDSRDYKKSHDYYGVYLTTNGLEKTPCPRSIDIGKTITQEEHDIQMAAHRQQYREFREWCVEHPEPEYCDFWHWIVEDNYGIGNGTFFDLETERSEDEEIPDWVQEILQLIKKEFVLEGQDTILHFWTEW